MVVLRGGPCGSGVQFLFSWSEILLGTKTRRVLVRDGWRRDEVVVIDVFDPFFSSGGPNFILSSEDLDSSFLSPGGQLSSYYFQKLDISILRRWDIPDMGNSSL